MSEERSERGTIRVGRSLWLAVAAAVGLVTLFVVGYEVYVHVGGQLLARVGGSAPAASAHGANAHVAGALAAREAVPTPLLLTLAVVGGAASFFSPCSVAISPSFLIYFLGADPRETADSRLRKRLLVGSLLVALGIIVFYGIIGGLVAWIGAALYNVLIYLIPVVGVVFLALGVLILLGRGDLLGWIERLNPAQGRYGAMLEERAPKKPPALFAFGGAYGAASHTCTLPIFLGIVLVPLATANYALAAASVLLYGIAIAVLLVVMALLGTRVVGTMRHAVGRSLQYVAGVLFLLTAGYLFYYFGLNYWGLPV